MAGALVALSAFWPRRYGAIEVRILRDRYLAAEPEFARLRLLDTQITTTEELAETLYKKGEAPQTVDVARCGCRASHHGGNSPTLRLEVLVEKEPKEQTPQDQAQPGGEETPPPFQPDYELITVLERGRKEEQRFRREVEERKAKGNSGSER